jgi:fumarate hydratase subunit alpha
LKIIYASQITEAIATSLGKAHLGIPKDVTAALSRALKEEESVSGKEILQRLIENSLCSIEQRIPACQDTGITLIFVELGQQVTVTHGCLNEAINEGVKQGTIKYRLRNSIVCHPLNRINTNDNTPAVIHTEIVPGDKVRISILPKGAGSENLSFAKILAPTKGQKALISLIVKTVKQSGANACPPLILGIGLGGTIEKAALLSKKALLRKVGEPNPNPTEAALEEKLLHKINQLGIGPAGLGGKITALAVHIESCPCPINSLPIAVTFQCHSVRHITFEL